VTASFIKRIAFSILRVLIISFIGFCLLLMINQHAMIYHPRSYGRNEIVVLQRVPVQLHFKTSQGEQTAFYLPPAAGISQPEKMWVMFGGNGSLALDWRGVISKTAGPGDGFLMVDYPGYGECQGSASPASIEENAEKALEQVAEMPGMDRNSMEGKLSVMGHSLGCATALNFAVHHPVDRVILISPFTSLLDMARRTVGFPLCYLLTHHFNNRARLAELASRVNPPLVYLFHGTDDEIIPVAMGRELSAMFPKMIRFKEFPEAGHESILNQATLEIRDAMEGKR